MKLNEETIEFIKNDIKQKLGISYGQYINLDYDERQKLINNYKKDNKNDSEYSKIMVGSGEDAIFVNVKSGSRHMLDDGAFYTAGISLEKRQTLLNEKEDNILYCKPRVLVRKLIRRVKK